MKSPGRSGTSTTGPSLAALSYLNKFWCVWRKISQEFSVLEISILNCSETFFWGGTIPNGANRTESRHPEVRIRVWLTGSPANSCVCRLFQRFARLLGRSAPPLFTKGFCLRGDPFSASVEVSFFLSLSLFFLRGDRFF